jgi:hypothetical protein
MGQIKRQRKWVRFSAQTRWYHNSYWIFLIGDKYVPEIDGSEWDTMEGAKAHIDYLTK